MFSSARLSLTWACLLLVFGLAQVHAKKEELVGVAKDKAKARFGDNTIERTVQLRTHSLYAPYIDQDLQNRWWDFGADTYVNTNKHIRLTRDRPSQMGWLWSRLPLTSGNWVMEVEFKVSGSSTNLFGDGLAIWITKGRAQPGPAFGSVDKWEGFGIFLDTYANARHPYAFPRITGIANDGNVSYNVGSDGDKQGVGACSLNFRRTNVATKVKVTYIKETLLDVKLQYKAWDDWTDCFRWESTEGKPVKLPSAPFIGFSAMTGDVSDNHDIIAVSTYSAILSKSVDGASSKSAGKGGFKGSISSSSGWGWTFVKFLLFGGLCAGAFFGWKEYNRRGGFGGSSFGGLGSSGFGSGGMGGGYSSGGGSSGGYGNGGGYGGGISGRRSPYNGGGYGSDRGLGTASGMGGVGGYGGSAYGTSKRM